MNEKPGFWNQWNENITSKCHYTKILLIRSPVIECLVFQSSIMRFVYHPLAQILMWKIPWMNIWRISSVAHQFNTNSALKAECVKWKKKKFGVKTPSYPCKPTCIKPISFLITWMRICFHSNSSFFTIILAIATISTLIELYCSNPSKNVSSFTHTSIIISFLMSFCFKWIPSDELLVSFSLWKNTKALFSLERNPSDLSTIHGIRFINAALLLISHKSMALFYNPYMNRTRMIEVSPFC